MASWCRLPYEEGFREYIFKAMQTVAAHQPDCIMADDDLRLIERTGSGCACPLHMKRFNNYSRKQQLIKILEQTEELPAYYPNDEEIYFRAADLPDGNLLCAVFNLGFDPIEQLELVCRDQIQKIEHLTPDGTWKEAAFAVTDGRCRLEIPCDPVTPVVLRLQRGGKNE